MFLFLFLFLLFYYYNYFFIILFINYFILFLKNKKKNKKGFAITQRKFRKPYEIFVGSENFSLWPYYLPPDFVSLITFSSELCFRWFWYRWKA